MNILFVLPTLSNGGAERVASILATKMSENHKVEIFTLEQPETEPYILSSKVILKSAGIKANRENKLKALLSFIITFCQQKVALKKEIKIFKPDFVISFLPKADILIFAIFNKNFKWIASERNDPSRRNMLERKILNYIYKKTSILVCQTDIVASYYKNKGIEQVVVIENPCIIEDISNSENINDLDSKFRYIISIGRLDQQKNYKMLINAFSDITNIRNFKLIILGTGKQKKELEKLIAKRNMQDKIFLLGRKKNVISYLNQSEFFVMSSDYEGMPNALLEAMAASLPIITTNFFTGAWVRLVDHRNGIVVPVGDSNKMSDAIQTMIDMPPEKLKQMGSVSREKIKEYSIENIQVKWEKLLNDITESTSM